MKLKENGTLDKLLKNVSIRVASHELFDDVRQTARNALMRCRSYQGQSELGFTGRIKKYVLEYIGEKLPDHYKEYGRERVWAWATTPIGRIDINGNSKKY